MRGATLQKLGRNAEAAVAFQAALCGVPQNGAVWMSLGISLEALGKKAEAAYTFRRAAATESLSTDGRSYVEQWARQLQ